MAMSAHEISLLTLFSLSPLPFGRNKERPNCSCTFSDQTMTSVSRPRVLIATPLEGE